MTRRVRVPGTEEVPKLKSEFPHYHTTDEIREEIGRLQGACNGMLEVTQEVEGQVTLDVATIRSTAQTPVRAFLLFGEHSRELISPESGLHFLRVLCGEEHPPSGAPSPSDVLKGTSFQLVLNANPRSRMEVEAGDYCLRTNPNGVDLNRNWDEQWVESGDQSATNPGPSPFSEPETRILKRLVTDFQPTLFLTVHSGTLGMYMPWAYDMQHLAVRNQPAMLELLKDVDAEHCQCPFGAAGKEVGYSCPGTCLDWVYDKLSANYSFAFEIYANPAYASDLKHRWQQKMADSGAMLLLQEGKHLGHPHFGEIFARHKSDFIQTTRSHRAHLDSEQEPESCFALFNPGSEPEFKATLNNWSAVYLKTAARVAEEVAGDGA